MAETKNPKYIICLFKLDGHTTWRMTTGNQLQDITNQLKLAKGVTSKKFFEIDRLTGTFEEF